MSPQNESIVRRLRDNIYGPEAQYCTEAGWQGCKHNWLKPDNIRWLMRQKANSRETVPIELLK